MDVMLGGISIFSRPAV